MEKRAMTEIINVHRVDPTNVGDMCSSPASYFDWLQSVPRLDMYETNFEQYQERLSSASVIVGGGGVLQFSQIQALYDASPGLLVAWGAGHNVHGGERLVPDSRLAQYDLVGIRDFGLEHQWVPCSSSLHRVFDGVPEPEHEAVVYEHKDRPLGIEGVPVLTNREQHIEKVASFLGSAATVITNSYHGVYWATLLKRKVICVDPFSTKFQAFKHPPHFAAADEWRSGIPRAKVYDEALDECRDANLEFSEMVRALFDV